MRGGVHARSIWYQNNRWLVTYWIYVSSSLLELFLLLSLSVLSLCSLEVQLEDISGHVIHYLDSADKEVAGTTYRGLRELIVRASNDELRATLGDYVDENGGTVEETIELGEYAADQYAPEKHGELNDVTANTSGGV